MLTRIIEFSVRNKLVIALLTVGLIAWGIFSLRNITIDAVPDITNNQVQIVTVSPNLAAQEVEQFITYPIEMTMANVPRVVELRSVSRYGLSVVTVVFEEKVPILDARQLVGQQLALAKSDIPEMYGEPELMPITTGLGEIYQYTLEVEEEYEEMYSAMDLRTIHDWIVKRQLNGIPGIVEISSFGGFVKQYEVAVDPNLLRTFNLSLLDVNQALESNNQNTGGGYIDKGPYVYYIRADGLLKDISDIENVVVDTRGGNPVLIKDIGSVGISWAPRFGAMTKDGKGEAVGGITLMLKGGNASSIIKEMKERIKQVNNNLPEGVSIEPYLDRSVLVKKVIHTVTKNLVEGGLIVIFILLLMLGDWRAGLIVASVIPLAMLFAFSMMNAFGVTATVMSLGAIDFGLIVDATVIIVEGIIHQMEKQKAIQGKKHLDELVLRATLRIKNSAAFGALIILIVYFPLLTLIGIEGKMFTPMATTVSFAIIGALILSFTYIPMVSSLFLRKKTSNRTTIADRVMGLLHSTYRPVFRFALRQKPLIILIALGLMGSAFIIYNQLGAEFLPDLNEGDLAMQMTNPPGCSLEESIKSSTRAEKILLDKFPEVKHVISKIGTAEVPTDPMAIEDADIMITLKNKKEWVSAKTRTELIEKMKTSLSVIPGVAFEFTQPIQLRFNELLTGAKSDVVVKIYGEDLDVLFDRAHDASRYIETIEGAEDVRVERIEGLPQIVIEYDRHKVASYGLNIADLNSMVRTAMAGEQAGYIFEGERKFDLVVRLGKDYRDYIADFDQLYIRTPSGKQVPIKEVAEIQYVDNPVQISRDDTHRRITIGMNVRNRDVQSVVDDVQEILAENTSLPPGYYYTYGGKFENLQSAFKRLKLIVPVALLLIFILLYFAFKSLKQAAMIFSIIPLSIIGGVFALWIRGLPFSISAGVGFIALFGVAVLDGIVLINHLNELKAKGMTNLHRRIITATRNRLRPVAITSAVAALGFLPMAVSTTAGAEVQRPLATVVIGGIITSTFLTMVLLPLVYYYSEKWFIKPVKINKSALIIILLLLIQPLSAQDVQKRMVTLEEAEEIMLQNNPSLRQRELSLEQAQKLSRAKIDLGTTDVSYEYGQINSDIKDYRLSVGQNLENLPESMSKAKMYRKEAEKEQLNISLYREYLKKELRQAFVQYRYLENLAETIMQTVSNYNKLIGVAAEKRQLGETSSLEMLALQTEAGNMIIRYKDVNYRVESVLNNLQTLTYSDERLIPVKKQLEPVLIIEEYNRTDTLHRSLWEKSLEQSRAQIGVEKSVLVPDFYFGYFNQKIDGLTGYQGVEAGVSLPLWFMPQQKKIASSKIEYKKNEFNVAEQEAQRQKQIRNVTGEMEMINEKLAFYRDNLVPVADSTEIAVIELYNSGDISYIELTRNLGNATSIREEYLDIIKTYNINAFELQYLKK